MRGLIFFLCLLGFAGSAAAVPYDRATVRLGRAEPLLVLPPVHQDPAPTMTAPRFVHRKTRDA
jgi:hypothetical protein